MKQAKTPRSYAQSATLYVRCSPEELSALETFAAEEGRSLAEFVRRTLRKKIGLPVNGGLTVASHGAINRT